MRLAPAPANVLAASKPIPLFEPVMMIHFPVRSGTGRSFSVRVVLLVPLRAFHAHQSADGC